MKRVVLLLAALCAQGAAHAAGPAPVALEIATLDGTTFDLSKERGHWVVLNFWATWCAPCLKEIPDLDAFDQSRDDVRVLGLAYEDITPEDMTAFIEEHPIGYPVAIVDVYDPPAAFEAPRGLPMTYLVGPDGTVAKKFLGPITTKELVAVIDAKPAK